MQLVFYRYPVIAAGFGERSAPVGVQEGHHFGGCDMRADGIDAVPGSDGGPVNLGQLLGGQDYAAHLPPSFLLRRLGAGQDKEHTGQKNRKTGTHYIANLHKISILFSIFA
jgi:hypothetical protein